MNNRVVVRIDVLTDNIIPLKWITRKESRRLGAVVARSKEETGYVRVVIISESPDIHERILSGTFHEY